MDWREVYDALLAEDAGFYEEARSDQWPVRVRALNDLKDKYRDSTAPEVNCYYLLGSVGRMLSDSVAPVRLAALDTLAAIDMRCVGLGPISPSAEHFEGWTESLAEQYFLRRIELVYGVELDAAWLPAEKMDVAEQIMRDATVHDKSAISVALFASGWANAIRAVARDHHEERVADVCFREMEFLASLVGEARQDPNAWKLDQAAHITRSRLFGGGSGPYGLLWGDAYQLCSAHPSLEWVFQLRRVYDVLPSPTYESGRNRGDYRVGSPSYHFAIDEIDTDDQCWRIERRGPLTPVSYWLALIQGAGAFGDVGNLLQLMSNLASSSRMLQACEYPANTVSDMEFGYAVALEEYLSTSIADHWSESSDFVLRLFGDVLLVGTEATKHSTLEAIRRLGHLAEPVAPAVAFVADYGETEALRRDATTTMEATR